jgi:hypothetical protein
MTERISQSGELRLHGPVEKVFALFTPKGELLWIPTWKYTPVYPASGETEQAMVFRTEDGATTWTLAHYDPPNRSVYVFMNANVVVRIEVTCRAASPTETIMRIAYTWTALTEQAHHLFPTDEAYKVKIENWKEWLGEYAVKAGWKS